MNKTSNIVGEEVPGYVINQIKTRQILHGTGINGSPNRTNEQILALNSRTAWIKLASGVSVDTNKLTEMKINDSYEPGMDLAKKNVLFGGISTLDQNTGYLNQREYLTGTNGAYQSSEFGPVPMPGIISMDIKALNRGSLKKATIKLKAHNRQQFEIIDVLYLRLGYTVMLEWGNNHFTDAAGNTTHVLNTIIEDPFRFFAETNSSKKSYLDMLPIVEFYRNKYQGNYDGILGKISNFSWSFNNDGSYDIEITVISLGDVVESLKLNIPPDKSLNAFIANAGTPPTIPEEDPGNADQSDLIEQNKYANTISSMLWLWKYINDSLIKAAGTTNPHVDIVTADGTIHWIGNILKSQDTTVSSTSVSYEYTTTILKSENGGWNGRTETTKLVEYLKYDTYTVDEKDIDDDALEKQRVVFENKWINDPEFKFANVETSEAEPITPKTKTVTIDNPIKGAPAKSVFFTANTEPNQFYIRFGYLLQYIKRNVLPKVETDGTNPPIFDIFHDQYINKMYFAANQISLDPRVCAVRNDHFKKPAPEPAKVYPQLAPFRQEDFNPSKVGSNIAYPMNIYLNFNFVIESLNSNSDERGDVAIFGFLSSICNGLNKALGGINNLEPIIDEENNTLKIIDSTPIPGYTKDKGDYILQLYGYNGNESTFVRNVDLKTAITPEYATMITVGATAGGYVKGIEATAFSKWNKGLKDRFKENWVAGNLVSTSVEGEPDEAETNYLSKFLQKQMQCYGYSGTWGPPPSLDVNSTVIENNLAVVTEYYKYIQNKNKSGGSIGFIPFKLGLTMDGIGGIKIYNKLHINTDFLPSNYSKTLDIIVTGVNHSLQNNDWETKIEAMVIPKTNTPGSANISNAVILDTIIKTAPFIETPSGGGSTPVRSTNCPVINFKTDDRSRRIPINTIIQETQKIFPELSKKAIAGILGVAQWESQFNPTAYNEPTKDSPCGAVGLIQWVGSRQKGLFNYANKKQLKVDDVITQLKYLRIELLSSYPELWTLLQNPNLLLVQYVAIFHISQGLGSWDPYTYYKTINNLPTYEKVYTEKNGKSFKSVSGRLNYAEDIFKLL